jgi:hypothetical protein
MSSMLIIRARKSSLLEQVTRTSMDKASKCPELRAR